MGNVPIWKENRPIANVHQEKWTLIFKEMPVKNYVLSIVRLVSGDIKQLPVGPR